MKINLEQDKFIIIVGAYSSGAKLVEVFRMRGYKCIHVTTQKLWEIDRLRKTFVAKDFYANYVIANENEENIYQLLDNLFDLPIHAVLAGSEPSIILTDTIVSHFQVATNDLVKTFARRDKHAMINAVKNAKLKAPKQLKTDNVTKALKWIADNEYKNVILKPLASAGSDSVYKCYNSSEVIYAFNEIINHTNIYNEINHSVLVQEYIDGDEYIVNSVSSCGHHYITDIWKGYSETPDLISTDSYADLVTSDNQHYSKICEYAQKVLTAVGVANGPAHTELRITHDGPCFIEVGARLAGKVNFHVVNFVLGIDQLQLTVDAIVNTERFPKIATSARHCNHKYMRYVYLSSPIEGMVRKHVPIKPLFNIDSVRSVNLQLEIGDYLFRTDKIRRRPRPGYAYLVADNRDKLESDYRLFKEHEIAIYKDALLDKGLLR